MVAILDYGVGNIASILNMFSKIGAEAMITADPNTLRSADKLLLPGVGHFDYCMQQLRKAPFLEALQQRVLEDKVPMLGVCVGCQMLMESSEEGKEQGLGWLKGKVIKFDRSKIKQELKVPHMGWTDVHPVRDTPLFRGIEEPRFYFVHSYHVQCDDINDVQSTADYGYPFTASVERNNIMAVQFHPEKSHRFGMRLLENFVNNY